MADLAGLIERSFEIVAQWHDKNARFCLEASKDDPRMNADDRRRAFEAYRHHAASAAAIRDKMADEKQKLFCELERKNSRGSK